VWRGAGGHSEPKADNIQLEPLYSTSHH
jgi:hypothetical protein